VFYLYTHVVNTHILESHSSSYSSLIKSLISLVTPHLSFTGLTPLEFLSLSTFYCVSHIIMAHTFLYKYSQTLPRYEPTNVNSRQLLTTWYQTVVFYQRNMITILVQASWGFLLSYRAALDDHVLRPPQNKVLQVYGCFQGRKICFWYQYIP